MKVSRSILSEEELLANRICGLGFGAGAINRVSELLAMFAHEIRVGMALTGVRTVAEIDRSVLASASGVLCSVPVY